MNTLYNGDNLNILRRYIKDESVDLVYLDLPVLEHPFKQAERISTEKTYRQRIGFK